MKRALSLVIVLGLASIACGPAHIKPFTAKNRTFAFFVASSIARRPLALSPFAPSMTKTGMRIECSHRVGDRSWSSFGSAMENGLSPSPYPSTSSVGPNENTARNESEHSAVRRARVPPVL